MALSSGSRSSRPSRKQAQAVPPAPEPPARSTAEKQSAADEIEKLLNGFFDEEPAGGMANDVKKDDPVPVPMPEAPATGIPSSEPEPPSVISGPEAGGPLDPALFGGLPPAVTSDEEAPAASVPPPSGDEPPARADAFSLDDFVLPAADLGEKEAPPPPAAPPPEEPSPPAVPLASAAEVPPPLETAADPDPAPAEAPRRTSEKKRRPRKARKERESRGRTSAGDHQNVWVALIVLAVVALYACFFYGEDLWSSYGKKGRLALPGAPDVGAVTRKVTKTLKKALPPAGRNPVETDLPREDVPKPPPAVTVSPVAAEEAVPGPPVPVRPQETGPSAVAEVLEEAPSAARPPVEKQDGAADQPPVGAILEGNEIVPTNTVFVEWPDIMVSGILGRGKEGGAIINDELISIGEPCSAGPVLLEVAPMKATFRWNGDTRDYFLNTKSWGKLAPRKKR